MSGESFRQSEPFTFTEPQRLSFAQSQPVGFRQSLAGAGGHRLPAGKRVPCDGHSVLGRRSRETTDHFR